MKKENDLTPDEKSEIAKLNAEYQNCVFSIGELTLRKKQLKNILKSLKNRRARITSTRMKSTIGQFMNPYPST